VETPLVALAFAGCSRVTVTTDHDRSANFGALHTFCHGNGVFSLCKR